VRGGGGERPSTLAFLLSAIYSGALAPAHLADLSQPGLSDETIRLHRIRSVPPAMIGGLLEFEVARIGRRC
jgi:hypothetical protein